MDYE